MSARPRCWRRCAAIAPVVAVRGNNDQGAWARALRERETSTSRARACTIIHDLKSSAGRRRADVAAVIAGHSHQPSITERDGVVFLNPGSAGPRRFTLPVSVAHAHRARGPTPRARLVPAIVWPYG